MMPVGVDIKVYFCSKSGSIYNSTYKNGKTSLNEIKNDDKLDDIYEIRRPRKNPCSWEMSDVNMQLIKESDEKAIQFKLDNENDHLILSMRFNSLFDKNNDVVILNFKPELSFFGIEGGQIKMNTSHKTIISNLLYKSSGSVLEQSQEDFNKLKGFANKTKATLDTLKQYKQLLKQVREDHHKNIVSIAQSFISGLSSRYCVEFIFTDECIDALKDFSSDLPRLKVIVENAAEYAYSLNSFDNLATIVIEEEYLEIDIADVSTIEQQTEIKKSSTKPDKKERAEIMLSKLEFAVKRVMANKEKMNGTNVGKSFNPPISAPAITDYLKKHFDEINEILRDNPSKYPVSRANFRPLKNVISEKQHAKTA